MNKENKKNRIIHIGLVVLIIVLGLAVIREFIHNGTCWFSREIDTKPQVQGYIVMPSEGFVDPNPYKEMDRIHRNMEQLFNNIYRDLPESGYKESYVFEPEIDVEEKDNEYIVKCNLPGISKEDINIAISGNYLTISGSLSSEKEENKEGKYFYKERRSGNFKRVIQIPGAVSEDNIKAEYDKGILTVNIQKIKSIEEVKPKKVQII